jgi:hypothetical protein
MVDTPKRKRPQMGTRGSGPGLPKILSRPTTKSMNFSGRGYSRLMLIDSCSTLKRKRSRIVGIVGEGVNGIICKAENNEDSEFGE